ncbi:hypothetical protein [Pseudomonas amygdali]|uniref:Thiol:disulfide interchange protein DsbA n=2 Tax=Pseudomonas amygdali pv. lachrymans TaxID=53707 RepID=A0AAD0M478_PSEAV|nr:hypothetical protein [Pseudomonas amygdali]AXH59509.1 hypothetical protein PLA107_030240 [Pseudomonas amygdali pv. lachrymans str. M301315]RMT05824.1 Thiol:disulfide interchange protein DsbA [Pseudomonas amygdali pv. lachrymans]
MPASKRSIWLFAAATAAVVVALACAFIKPDGFSSPELSPGRPVTVIAPQSIPSDAVFLFWYGCPHCRAVESIFDKNDADAKFSQAMGGKQMLAMIPVPINEVWETHARLFYALSHAGVSAQTHRLMMATIQDKQLVTKADMKQAIAVALAAESQAGHPVNFSAEAVFTDLDSKQTDEQISLAKSLVAQIGLKGVPTLLLKKSVVLELGNGMNYDNFLPTAIDILRGTASHD